MNHDYHNGASFHDLKNAAAHGALLRGGGARAHQGGHGASQLRRRRLLGDLEMR